MESVGWSVTSSSHGQADSAEGEDGSLDGHRGPESLRRHVETWSAAKPAKPQKAVARGCDVATVQDTHSASLVKGTYRLTISLQGSGDVAMQKTYHSETNSLTAVVEARDRLMLAAVLRLREEHGGRSIAAPGGNAFEASRKRV